VAELVWDGKYHDGRRVLPDHAPRALLTDEVADLTATESAATRQEETWRNRLIHGDTRDVLPALLPELAGRVSLVYMDPPFATGADQTIAIPLPHDGASGAPSQPSIQRVAFRDTWGPGLDGYLQWFFETVTLLREPMKGLRRYWRSICARIAKRGEHA
jgi:adenine-specific DNA-methyltransferase